MSVFFLHVGALRSAFTDVLVGGEVSTAAGCRLLTLGLSAAFFALKIADVFWLRVRPGWRGLVTSVLLLAILHAGVSERMSGVAADASHPMVGLLLCAGGVSYCDAVRRRLQTLRSALSTRRKACQRLLPTLTWRSGLERAFLLAFRDVHNQLVAPRAPPCA